MFKDLLGYVLTAILLNIVIFNRKSACFLFSTSTNNVSFFNFFFYQFWCYITRYDFFNYERWETSYWRAFGFYSNESREGRFYFIFWISSLKFLLSFFICTNCLGFLCWKIHIFIVWVSLTMLPTHHGAPFGDTPRGKPIRLGIPGLHNQYTHADGQFY